MAAVGCHDAADPAAGADDPSDPGAERDLGTPTLMRLGKEPSGWRRHYPAHRLLCYLDDVDGGAESDRDRGKFETDEARPDDDHLARFVQSLPQRIRIGERAQRQ